jgi:hypothetical protein
MGEIQKFEGADVVGFEAKFPSITVEADQPFKRGSIIRMAVEARVKGVSFREDSDGNIIRTAQLGLNDISVVSTYDPEAAQDMVGGSLAGGTVEVDLDDATAAELGLDVGRTGELWPPRDEAAAQAVEVP